MWHVMPSHLLAFDFFEVARDDGRTGRHRHKGAVGGGRTPNRNGDKGRGNEGGIQDGTMKPPPPPEEEDLTS